MILYAKAGRSETWTHIQKMEISLTDEIRYTSGDGWSCLDRDSFDAIYLFGDNGSTIRVLRDNAADRRAEKLATAQVRKEARRTRETVLGGGEY